MPVIVDQASKLENLKLSHRMWKLKTDMFLSVKHNINVMHVIHHIINTCGIYIMHHICDMHVIWLKLRNVFCGLDFKHGVMGVIHVMKVICDTHVRYGMWVTYVGNHTHIMHMGYMLRIVISHVCGVNYLCCVY